MTDVLFQGVKDYAEQQRRLMQDIMMYGQRNRELARKREEQEKLKETQLKEEAELREAQGRGDEDAGSVERPSDLQEAVEERQKEVNPVDCLKHNLHLNLSTSGATRELTLESPAFVSQVELPIPEEPAEQETVATPVDSAEIDVTIDPEYPLSPVIVSDGKTILTPVQRHPLTMIPSPPELPATCQVASLSTSPGAAGRSPQTSPNSRRRFVICRVKEHSGSKTRPVAVHGHLPAASNGLSVNVQSSAANTQSSASSTDTVLNNVVMNRTVTSNTSPHQQSDVGRDQTLVCVQGLIDSIVDQIIRDVIAQYESVQLLRVSESGDTRLCRPALNAQRLVDTGCGDVSQSGACAANENGVHVGTATAVGQSDNIPIVGTEDSELVFGDTTTLSLPCCTGPRDITSGDQIRQACPVTVHNSNHVSVVVSGRTTTSLADELMSFGHIVTEFGHSVNESVSSVNSGNEFVSSVNSASESVSSVNSASESVSYVNSASESVSSVNSASESVSYVNSASESVSSVNSASESVSYVNSASESVSSVNCASESVSSVNGASESVSSVNIGNEFVSSVNSASESVSYVNSASESVSSVNSASESVNSANESVSSVNSVNEGLDKGADADCERVEEVASPPSEPTVFKRAAAGTHNLNIEVSPKSDKTHAAELDQCHASEGVSLESVKLMLSPESDQCHIRVEVSSKSDHCHVANEMHNTVATLVPSPKRSGTSALTVSPCHQTECSRTGALTVSLCHQTECSGSGALTVSTGHPTECTGTGALTVSPCHQTECSGTSGLTVSPCYQTECSGTGALTVSPCHQTECSGTSGLTVSPCHQTECSGTGALTVSPCHQTEPNLHSALTMNGMKVELASVLDSLDQQFDPLASHQGESTRILNVFLTTHWWWPVA